MRDQLTAVCINLPHAYFFDVNGLSGFGGRTLTRFWSRYFERIKVVIRAKRVSNCYIPKTKSARVRVCSSNLCFSVGSANRIGQNTVYLCLSKYILFENTRTATCVTTAASEMEGVAAVSWIDS